jgi:hypothetical protein
MKQTDLLLPSVLFAALLGAATLVFAVDEPRTEVFASPTLVSTLVGGVSPHLLMAP